MKKPKCKICGSEFHTAYKCAKNPKLNVKKSRKTSSKSGSKPKRRTEPLSGSRTQIKRSKPKTIPRNILVKRLDSIFSQYIRQRDDGVCFTCGIKKDWKEMQCGHFYTRGRYPTRWDEMNCNCQCVGCNIFLKGNYINYTRKMIDIYGREAIDTLEVKSLSTDKIPTPVLLEMIEEYKIKIDTEL